MLDPDSFTGDSAKHLQKKLCHFHANISKNQMKRKHF